eukprot:1267571-Rhodomonas_salina.2
MLRAVQGGGKGEGGRERERAEEGGGLTAELRGVMARGRGVWDRVGRSAYAICLRARYAMSGTDIG